MYEFNSGSIIICNQKLKEDILKEAFLSKRIANYKFFSFNDIKEKLYFKITKQAIIYAMDFLGMSYQNTKLILSNIYYLDDSFYDDPKLKLLSELKDALYNNNLLEFDHFFISSIKNKDIYILQNTYSNFEEKMISDLAKNANIIKLNKKIENKEYTYHQFDDFTEEVDYLFIKINELIKNNVPLKNIYVVSDDIDYLHLINRNAHLYNLPLSYNDNNSIISSDGVKYFFDELQNDTNIEEIFNNLKNKTEASIYAKILNLYNEFYFIKDRNKLLKVLKEEVKNIKFDIEKYDNSIQVVSFDHNFNDNDHVFILNFSNGNIPKLYIDDEYLGDKYQKIIPITLTIDKNKNALIESKYKLNDIKNVYISYSFRAKEEKTPSSLIRILSMKKVDSNKEEGISAKNDLLKYGKYMDDFINYHLKNENLSNLHQTFKNTYQTYNNEFDFVDKKLLHEKLNGKIRLSYSSISTFYKCQFYYYLEKVLGIKIKEDKSAARLGERYHAILEDLNKPGFNLEERALIELNKIEDIKERFYFKKCFPDLKRVISFIEEMKEYTSLLLEKHEEEITINYENYKYVCEFTGIIDKVIYTEHDGKDYLAIVDYKSGSVESKLDNINLGFNLQLPIYAYLLTKSNLFKNPEILGVYLQKLIPDIQYSTVKDVKKAKYDAIKLDGFTNSDTSLLPLLDKEYENSKMIKSLSYQKGKFGARSRVLSAENINEIIGLVERLITDAFTMIENGEFPINPKSIDNKNHSCTYCHFEDICNKKYKDIEEHENKKIEEIVGGDVL